MAASRCTIPELREIDQVHARARLRRRLRRPRSKPASARPKMLQSHEGVYMWSKSLMRADHPPCPYECVQQLMQCARSCAIALLMRTERSHSVCFQVVPHAVKSFASAHMERAGWQVYLRTQLSNSTACSSGPLHAAGNRPLNGTAGDHGDSNRSKCSSPCASGSTEPADRCNLPSRRQHPAAACAPPAQQAYDAAVAAFCCRLYMQLNATGQPQRRRKPLQAYIRLDVVGQADCQSGRTSAGWPHHQVSLSNQQAAVDADIAVCERGGIRVTAQIGSGCIGGGVNEMLPACACGCKS